MISNMAISVFNRKNLRSLDIKWILLVFVTFAIFILFLNCQLEKSCQIKEKVHYVKLEDNVRMDSNPMAASFDSSHEIIYPFNRDLPLRFIGGVPRSGTTLMRAIMDAHPLIRCKYKIF